jgi:hypothetical protein
VDPTVRTEAEKLNRLAAARPQFGSPAFDRLVCKPSRFCRPLATFPAPNLLLPESCLHGMTREKLIEIARRYTEWHMSADTSPEALAAIVAPDVVLYIPSMGVSPDFAGLLTHHARVHVATNDMHVSVTKISVDEADSTVTQVWESTGHHTGYVSARPSCVPFSTILCVANKHTIALDDVPMC